jgi:membrane-associated phospholipid phosphatase
MVGSALLAGAQAAPDDSSPSPSPQSESQAGDLTLPPVDLKSLPRNLFIDQKNFWLSPFHMTESQLHWAVPVAFVGAAFLASDTAIENHVPQNPSTVSHAVTASNAGAVALVGTGAAMFLWGHVTNDDQQRETGLLSGEAGIDAFADAELLKYAFGRERPYTGSGKGHFFSGGTSFPSEHAAASWAIASVIAHEYPGPLTELLAYGVAGGVSAARVIGHQHFATDALVGSAMGWYIGRQVFRTHSHYSDADVARYGTFRKGEDEETARQPENMGSPYVPMDSWIYPAMDRLTALGYIHTGFADMRPWTRMECARQIKEAADTLAQEESPVGEADHVYQTLQKEFVREIALLKGGDNTELRLESAYTRGTEIAGKPLTDGDHFGQTIINDFGRPEEQGFNDVTGLSGWASYGPLTVYSRGEFQHSPGASAFPLTAREAISQADFSRIGGIPTPFPLPPDTPTPAFNETRFLDTYVALNLSTGSSPMETRVCGGDPLRAGP